METTRAYAFGKLEETGEASQTARRHAEFYIGLFALFAGENQLQAAIDDLGTYRREIGNFRAALNWAFSADGDTTIGIALAAAGADFWIAVSLVAEFLRMVGQGAGADRHRRRNALRDDPAMQPRHVADLYQRNG